MAKSIVGFHTSVGGNKSGTGAWIASANSKGIPIGIKGVSDYGLLFEATQIGNQHGVDNWLIYRLSAKAGSVSREVPNYTANPATDAKALCDEVLSKLPPEFDKTKVWIELINEPRGKWTNEPVFNNLHPVDCLGVWCHAAAIYLNGKGYKFCGPGFNSGEPGDDGKGLENAVVQYSQPGMLNYLQYCADNPDMAALAVHSYIWGFPAPQYPQLWGRFEAAVAAADLAGIPRTFPIFISEFGYSPSNAPTYPAVAPDLDKYNQICARFPQVKMAAAWTLQNGYDPVDDQVVTWTNYPIDKVFDPGPQPAKTHAAFGGTLPSNTGEPTMQTYSFESNNWKVLSDRLQQPENMILQVVAPGAPLWYPGGNGAATGTVEALHKGCNFTPPNLPPHQCAGGSDPLVLDGERCYKFQAVNMASGSSLKHTFSGTGRKRITVPVNVHWQIDTPNETNDVYAVLLLNGIEVKRLQHPELKDRTWHYMTGEADGPVTAELRFQTSWANSRDCFTDKWDQEDIEETPPMTWEEELIKEAEKNKVLAYKKGAALQTAIDNDGLWPRTNEFIYTKPDGVKLVSRGAIDIETAETFVYYCIIPNYSVVYRVETAGGTPTDTPFPA